MQKHCVLSKIHFVRDFVMRIEKVQFDFEIVAMYALISRHVLPVK